MLPIIAIAKKNFYVALLTSSQQPMQGVQTATKRP